MKRRAPARRFHQMPSLAGGLAILIGLGGFGRRIVFAVVVVWIGAGFCIMRAGLLLLLLTSLLDRLRLVLLSRAGGHFLLIVILVRHFEVLWLGGPAHQKTSPRRRARSFSHSNNISPPVLALSR